MRSSEEHYDDTAFTYFALSVLVIILVPSTLAYIKSIYIFTFLLNLLLVWRKSFSAKYTGSCGCVECRKKSKTLQIQSRKPSFWGLLKFCFYLLILFLFLFLIQKTTSETIPTSQVII